jgi:hypothetical protein
MSDIKVIKRKAKGFFQKGDLPTVEKAVHDVHDVMTNASILVKAYYLQWFQESNPLQDEKDALIIDLDLVSFACNIVQGEIKRPSRKKTDIVKDELFENMLSVYRQLYDRVNIDPCVSSDLSLSHILAYSKENLLTAYKNNILCHFKKYPKRYITCDILSRSQIDPKIAKKVSASVVNKYMYEFDITESHLEILQGLDLQPQRWSFLFPSIVNKKNLPRCWDLKVHPWIYLYKMVQINQSLEIDFSTVDAKHRCLLSPLPFHSSFIPMHIRLDTSGLSQLLMNKEKIQKFKDFYEAVSRCKFIILTVIVDI